MFLRFGYGVNFRYEGMLAHSFDRFYVVTRIEIPKVSDLNLTVFQFDYNCTHVKNIEKSTKFKVPDMIRDMFNVYCRNIIPYMYLYKHQVEYYEKMVYNILGKDSETDSDRESIHSNWSDLVPIKTNRPNEVITNDITQRKRTVRNIVLVPYKPKPKDWGSWKIKSPYATSTVASPILDDNGQTQTFNQNNENDEGKLTYIPHNPYYEPVHSPQFYGDE